MALVIKKALAVASDIEWGLTTVVQTRNGVEYTLDQVNAYHIPYSATETVGSYLESFQSAFDVAAGILEFPWPAKVVGNPIEGGNFQSSLSHVESAGILKGCDLTNNLPVSVDIAVGAGLFRQLNDYHSPMDAVEVDAKSITDLPEGTSFIIATYDNVNNAVIGHTTLDSDINHNTTIVLYTVTREGNDITALDVRFRNVASDSKEQRKQFETEPFEHAYGAIVSYNALDLIVSNGSFYYQSERIIFAGIDTSGTDTFTTYYGNDTNGYTKTVGVSSIPVQYYNGVGLVTTTNKYYVHWIYLILDSFGNSKISLLYGSTLHNTATLATEEPLPDASQLPDILTDTAVLIGRIIMYDSVVNSVDSVYGTTFNAAGVAEHESLAGLQGGQGAGATGEHYHFTGQEHLDIGNRVATTVSHMSNATLVSGLADGDTSTFIPGTTNLKSIPQSFSIPNNCETLLTTGLEGLVLETDVSITLGTNASLRII